MVKKQKFKDDTVRVSAQVYEELQQLWISDKLFVEHSPLSLLTMQLANWG